MACKRIANKAALVHWPPVAHVEFVGQFVDLCCVFLITCLILCRCWLCNISGFLATCPPALSFRGRFRGCFRCCLCLCLRGRLGRILSGGSCGLLLTIQNCKNFFLEFHTGTFCCLSAGAFPVCLLGRCFLAGSLWLRNCFLGGTAGSCFLFLLQKLSSAFRRRRLLALWVTAGRVNFVNWYHCFWGHAQLLGCGNLWWAHHFKCI